MLKIILRVLLLLTLVTGISVVPPVEAAIQKEDVAFVVVDPRGLTSREARDEWRSVVKWAYHFPYYRFTDGLEERYLVNRLRGPLVTVNKAELAELAQEHDLGVIVLVKVQDFEEDIVNHYGNPLFDNDNGPYVELDIAVDLYVYKQDSDTLLKQKVRQRETVEMGSYEDPATTVKWSLNKLLNKIEHRPYVGR